MRSQLYAAAALAALTACARPAPAPPSAPAPAPAAAARREPVKVVVVSTTDLHGWIEGRDYPPPAGVAPARTGGLDVSASFVDALRAANPGRVALIDSGDMFQGTLVSNLYEGEPVVQAYNAIGYAAAAVGNHEFDYGPVGDAVVPRAPGDDPLGALKHNVARMKFPLLGANVVEKATGRRPEWLRAHTLVDLDGVRLGVIGAASPLTPTTTVELNVRDLSFTDPAPAVIAAAAELRAAGADAVVVTAHMGAVCKNADDLATCDDDSEIVQLARALPPGTVDGIFAGHTHRPNVLRVNGTPVLQPLPFAQGLAVLELWVDPEAGRVTRAEPRLVDVCERAYAGTTGCDPRRAPKGAALEPVRFLDRAIAPRADVTALVAPWLEKVEARRNAKLGFRVAGPFTRDYSRGSTLGALVADALLAATAGADFAITNAGGLRADLRATEPTYGDLYEILPFDNLVSTIRLTGAELRELVGRTGEEGHGGHQIAGLHVVIDASKPVGAARVVSMKRADGRPIREDETYVLATNDFLARGGGNFATLVARLPADRVTLHDQLMRDVVIAQLQEKGKKGPLVPGDDGRMKIVGGLEPEAEQH